MREIAILIPVWNDWPSARELLTELDREAALLGDHSLSLFFVDDGSHTRADPLLHTPLHSLSSCAVLELYENIGHQRALGSGLGFLLDSYPGRFDGFLFMDGDGQDRPGGIRLLLGEASAHPEAAVAAARAGRQESFAFRLGYFFYRQLFFLLTGRRLRFGNFFYAPAAVAEMLALSPLSGTHLAASLLRSGAMVREVPLPRGKRIEGKPKMSRASLLLHGLRALRVFEREVHTRALVLLALTGLLSPALALGLALTLWAGLAAPRSYSLLPLLEGPKLVKRLRWIKQNARPRRRSSGTSHQPNLTKGVEAGFFL